MNLENLARTNRDMIENTKPRPREKAGFRVFKTYYFQTAFDLLELRLRSFSSK